MLKKFLRFIFILSIILWKKIIHVSSYQNNLIWLLPCISIWYTILFLQYCIDTQFSYISDSLRSWKVVPIIPFKLPENEIKYVFDSNIYPLKTQMLLNPKYNLPLPIADSQISLSRYKNLNENGTPIVANASVLYVLDGTFQMTNQKQLDQHIRNPILNLLQTTRLTYEIFPYPFAHYQDRTQINHLYKKFLQMKESYSSQQPIVDPFPFHFYSLVIFENIYLYKHFIAFNKSGTNLSALQILQWHIDTHGTRILCLSATPLDLHKSLVNVHQFLPPNQSFALNQPRDIFIPGQNPVTRITKSGRKLVEGSIQSEFKQIPQTCLALCNSSSYFGVSRIAVNNIASTNTQLPNKTLTSVPIVQLLSAIPNDRDGINNDNNLLSHEVIIFGGCLSMWPFRLLFLDSILFLMSQCKRHREKFMHLNISFKSDTTPSDNEPNLKTLEYLLNLDRYVIVDIDDGFVGQQVLWPSDVQDLVQTQNILRKYIQGFTFNIGFSGANYWNNVIHDGMGFKSLIKHASNFWWFPHSWDHRRVFHEKVDLNLLNTDYKLNLEFAQKYGLNMSRGYTVSPAHFGTYPIANVLYEAWALNNISISSTYLHPLINPVSLRRAFKYRNITILPRKTCGVYTHTLRFSQFTNNNTLETMVDQSDIANQLVYDKFNIIMTHEPNYGYDRLASHVLKKLFIHLTTHTNLKFKTVPPVEFAKLYTSHRSGEITNPIYQNPCLQRSLFLAWNRTGDCYRFPKILIIGPQKTGTTALLNFLQIHPLIRTSQLTKNFEETQFFSSNAYENYGLEWYLNLFRLENKFPFWDTKASDIAFVDKSASYFANAEKRVALRAFSLLPMAKIVVILKNPVDRAYSWYQHMKKHGNKAALTFSFDHIVTFEDSMINESGSQYFGEDKKMTKEILGLKQRCINDGLYYDHLVKWLRYYPASQIIAIDEFDLIHNPINLMNYLQKSLQLSKFFDFIKYIRYSPTKRFYCPYSNGRLHCLGISKGTPYPSMNNSTRIYLQQIYKHKNQLLYNLLQKNHLTIPKWLAQEILQ